MNRSEYEHQGVERSNSAAAAARMRDHVAVRGLRGPALLGARVTWLVLVALQLISFVSLLPFYRSLADHPCAQQCALTIQEAYTLTQGGIPPDVYLLLLLIVSVINVLLAVAIGGLLFLRRSYDVMALITAYSIVILPTTFLLNSAPIELGAQQATAFTLPLVPELALEVLQTSIIYGMFLLFPSGRFVPRWSWILLIAFALYTEVFTALPAGLNIIGWGFFLLSAGVCFGYRYGRVSTPVERQQTKWVIFGFIVFLVFSQAYWIPTFTPLGSTIYAPVAYLVYQFFLPVVPVTFFIAIQHYRLYDIDTIIRRTLVYGSLTIILAAIYVAGVVGSQAIIGGVTHATGHAQSPIIIVITTLVIAALFQPLRRRLQAFIDRRFYRRKYDAARTLAGFAAALRGQVDLTELTDQLLGAVEDTMQPAHVSLWLRGRE